MFVYRKNISIFVYMIYDYHPFVNHESFSASQL